MPDLAKAMNIEATNQAPPESQLTLPIEARHIWNEVEHLFGKAVDEVKTHKVATIVAVGIGAGLALATHGKSLDTMVATVAKESAGTVVPEDASAMLADSRHLVGTWLPAVGNDNFYLTMAKRLPELPLTERGYRVLELGDATAFRYHPPLRSPIGGTSSAAPDIGDILKQIHRRPAISWSWGQPELTRPGFLVDQ